MKLLITVNWNKQELDGLRVAYPEIEFVHAPTTADAVAHAANTDVVFGRIDRDVFLAAKQLKWIQCQGAGVETMANIPELVGSGIVVTNTSGAHAQTIAEHSFGMLIFLTRGFRKLDAAFQARTWAKLDYQPIGLSGLTLGVVGLGNIGRAIAKRGWAFDMNVIAVDANEIPKPDYVAELRLIDALPDLLRRADVVAISVPFTPETKGMLGAEMLALLKPTSYLIAISRGGIVDESALAAMLRDGRLAGAGLDVTEVEPLPESSPLWGAPNLVLTPHCSGRSKQTTGLATSIFKENLARFVAGKPLANVVDMGRGY
jgi:D-2-hydroxyacid dehydrogenase (NADP+)